MPVCLNHPDRIAYTKCQSCGKPLCEECKMTTVHGDFCSPLCAEQAEKFAKKFPGGVPPKKGGLLRALTGSLWRLVGVALALAFLAAVIVAAWGQSPNAPGFIRAAYDWAAGMMGM